MRLTRALATVGAVLFLGLAVPAAGLDVDSSAPVSSQPLSVLRLQPGAILRVTLQDGEEPVIGRYRAATSETIELESLSPASKRDIRTIPVDRAMRFEVSRKRKVHTWSGLLVGFLVGAAATYAVANGASGSDNPAALMGLVFIPVGMGCGALMGGGIVSYHWETIWDRARPSGP